MRFRLTLIVLVPSCLMLGVLLWHFAQKQYLLFNLLRFDPLEESRIDTRILITHEDITNIWLLGDSRIAQWDTDSFSSLNANIVNLGVDGQTTSQVLNRFRNALNYGKPQWLFLEAGINDLKIIGLKKDLGQKIVNGCSGNIYSIIDLCLQNSINVICINIFPTGKIELLRRLFWNSSVYSSINEVNENLEQYCHQRDVIYYDTDGILCDEQQKVKKEFQKGFLHINEKAYDSLSRDLLRKFGSKIIASSENTINKVQ